VAEKYLMRLGDSLTEVEVEEGPKGLRIRINDQWHSISLEQIGGSALFSLIVDDRPHEFFVEERSGGLDIVIGTLRYTILRERLGRPGVPASRPASPGLHERPGEAGGWVLLSPMTGLLQEVYVSGGAVVQAGDVLMVIEAMKMSNELRALRSGRVQEVYVSQGQRVEQGSALLLLATD
jgi:acetyl/propionyl-CoA carboxylase alpha subunit